MRIRVEKLENGNVRVIRLRWSWRTFDLEDAEETIMAPVYGLQDRVVGYAYMDGERDWRLSRKIIALLTPPLPPKPPPPADRWRRVSKPAPLPKAQTRRGSTSDP